MNIRKPSIVARLSRWAATLAGAGLASISPVTAQTLAPSAAPVEWVRYAEGATAAITGLLEADSETAIRFRAYLHQSRPAEDQPTPPLLLKVWVDDEGVVSRMEFAPFAHPEPNADLRGLVVGQRLPGQPPAGMLLPMRISVQLDAPATPSVEAATERAGDQDRFQPEMMTMEAIHSHGLAFLDGAVTARRIWSAGGLRAVIACADDDSEYGVSYDPYATVSARLRSMPLLSAA